MSSNLIKIILKLLLFVIIINNDNNVNRAMMFLCKPWTSFLEQKMPMLTTTKLMMFQLHGLMMPRPRGLIHNNHNSNNNNHYNNRSLLARHLINHSQNKLIKLRQKLDSLVWLCTASRFILLTIFTCWNIFYLHYLTEFSNQKWLITINYY